MDYKAALLKLQIDAPELAEIIASYVALINEESATRRVELRDSQAIVDKLKKIVGEKTDLLDFVATAQKQSADTESVSADTQAKLEAALLMAATEQRRYKLLKAAQLSGADEEALNKLLEPVETEKIAIDSDVKIDGKPLKEYAVGQAKFWETALFPQQQNNVPTGGKTSTTEEVNPATSYINSQAQRLLQQFGKV